MKLFDVYPRYPVNLTRGEGACVFDEKGHKYLDFYGGHAVISIGHTHPHFVTRITSQLQQLAFYSNSVEMPIQQALADKLGAVSGCDSYQLFLCNSGAEATENAIKVASFHTERKKVIVFEKGFHGRTSMSVEASDFPRNISPINQTGNIVRIPLNDFEALSRAMSKEVAAVMVEGIQGLSGVFEPTEDFLAHIRGECDAHGARMILDEVQSGYGRSGHFFAFQKTETRPDIICMAKGMGNGFPIGGILVHEDIDSWPGMLGTTFGGNHLACAAGLAVLEVIEQDGLLKNAKQKGDYLIAGLKSLPGVEEIRGRGLMLGLQLTQPAAELRKRLLFEHSIFTGSSSQPNTVRLLPPLSISESHCDQLITAFKNVLS